jgi:hypothetical protein
MGVLLSKTSSRLVAHGALPTEERSVESLSSVPWFCLRLRQTSRGVGRAAFPEFCDELILGMLIVLDAALVARVAQGNR